MVSKLLVIPERAPALRKKALSSLKEQAFNNIGKHRMGCR